MEHEWFQRVDLECRVGNLSRGERDVLRALGRLLAMGDDRPSEARLASEAGASRSTVQRAKRRARQLGLLDWDRRFAGSGLRRELPCAYRAGMPAQQVVRRERQTERRKEQRTVSQQLAAFPPTIFDPAVLFRMRQERLTALFGTRSMLK